MALRHFYLRLHVAMQVGLYLHPKQNSLGVRRVVSTGFIVFRIRFSEIFELPSGLSS